MNVYLFQAALLCEDCGLIACSESPLPEHPEDENTYDSDEYPKGPYSDGGGEADTPQHCDYCRVFLENPLTVDGVDYAQNALDTWPMTDTLREWSDFYGITRTPTENELLRDMLRRLLDCAELNQEEMEDNTGELIAEAEKILEKTKET